MARELWSGDYPKVLPVSAQVFELSAILPAVFYMFRFGWRRGRGRFFEKFGTGRSQKEQRGTATVERVVDRLTGRDDIVHFDENIGRAILGDLLLCFGLENRGRALGRDQQIQRVAPVHYLSSWIDLPESVSHLRYVPEMIVAMLANQRDGAYIEPTSGAGKTWFPVARKHEDNQLLRAFGQGVVWGHQAGNERGPTQRHIADLAADRFDEGDHGVGIDQLVMIRLAQELEQAPDKLSGSDRVRISNQRPISQRAGEEFSDDIRRFVRSYAAAIPRRSFVSMLESGMAVGMATIITSTAEILFHWDIEGEIPRRRDQRPVEILVDCSNGVQHELRRLSEDSLSDFVRRMEQFPRLLMTLRVLDYEARDNHRITEEKVVTSPYAIEWLELLGRLLFNKHEEADFIHRKVRENAEKLSKELDNEDYFEAAQILRNENGQENSIRRFAAGMTVLMGSRLRSGCIEMIDSMMSVDRPTGLARARRVRQGGAGTGPRTRVVRSLVLPDSALEYLVHLHLLRKGDKPGLRRLSFSDFLKKLRCRYGFCVDVAPRGMSVSADLLQTNRARLERRLRDLGLLRGVNDAEAMKCLRSRFSHDSRHTR